MTNSEIRSALRAIKLQLETPILEDKSKGIAGRPAFNVIAIFLQGSQNYDQASYTEEYMSDIDCKAFILPTFEDLYSNRKPYSKVIEHEWGQVEVKDIRKFDKLLRKSNPSYVELLFTEFFIVKGGNSFTQYGEDLVNDRRAKIMRAAYGMLCMKHVALKKEFEGTKDRIAKWGYDPKQLHHIVRLYYLVRDLAEGTKLYSEALKPVGEEHDFLMDLKMGKYDLEEAELFAKLYDEKTKKIVDDTPIEGTISNESVNKISVDVIKLVKEGVLMQLTTEYFNAINNGIFQLETIK